jgi:hypothetical protein
MSTSEKKRAAPEIAEDLEAKKQRLEKVEEAAEDKRRRGRDFLKWLFLSRMTIYGDFEDDLPEVPRLARLYCSVLKHDFADFKRGHHFHRVVWDNTRLRLELYESSEAECAPIVVELFCCVRKIWKPRAVLRDMLEEEITWMDHLRLRDGSPTRYPTLGDDESEKEDIILTPTGSITK